MLTSPDLTELLSLFEKHEVRYLVTGGYAVMRYTEPRYTKALDLWIATDRSNARAVFAALREFGAPLHDIGPEDFEKKEYFYQMGRAPFRVDIMMSIPGLEFEEAWERREDASYAGRPVPFISKADLIRSKETSGRPQDLLDVENLRKTESLKLP